MLAVLPGFAGHCLLEMTCHCSVDANSICFQLDVLLDGGDNMVVSSLCFAVRELGAEQLNQNISSLAGQDEDAVLTRFNDRSNRASGNLVHIPLVGLMPVLLLCARAPSALPACCMTSVSHVGIINLVIVVVVITASREVPRMCSAFQWDKQSVSSGCWSSSFEIAIFHSVGWKVRKYVFVFCWGFCPHQLLGTWSWRSSNFILCVEALIAFHSSVLIMRLSAWWIALSIGGWGLLLSGILMSGSSWQSWSDQRTSTGYCKGCRAGWIECTWEPADGNAALLSCWEIELLGLTEVEGETLRGLPGTLKMPY